VLLFGFLFIVVIADARNHEPEIYPTVFVYTKCYAYSHTHTHTHTHTQTHTQGVLGEIANTLGGSSMDYSE
jgi:hypothetical protein